MKLFTIGFTQSTAEKFFSRLQQASVKLVIDTRANRDGHLSGFAKMPDLQYFLSGLSGINYEAQSLLAPPSALLKDYREKRITWADYERRYREVLAERRPEKSLERNNLHMACLLCSEHAPDKCHRRLAAEHLSVHLGPIEIIHL